MTVTTEHHDQDRATPPTTRKVAFAVPILPGMADAHREALAAAEHGDARDQHVASRARAGITTEKVWHQDTPNGAIAIVYMEADDIGVAMQTLGTSDDPYDVSFREGVEQCHGVHLADGFPPPEQIFDWSASSG